MRLTISNIQIFLHQIRLKGFFHLLSANVVIQLFAFASQLFVAGILSPDDIGRIKIIQTYLAIFSIVAGMGFNASTLKICSERRPEEEKQRYFNTAFFFTVISSVVIYLLLLVVNYFELLTTDTLIKALIPIGLFPLISNSLFMLLMAYFQAGKNIRLFSTLTIFNKSISIIGILVFTWYMGISGYYIAYNISFVLMVLVALFASGKLVTRQSFKPNKPLLKHHWHYARSSVFSNIASEASAYIDIILISFLSTNMEQIGYYSFALTLTIALRIFPSTVQQISLPYFSEKSKNRSEFMAIYRRYNLLLMGIVVVSLIAFVLAMPIFLDLVFGTKYDASLPFLYLLSLGWSIRSLIQLRSSALFGLGKIEYNGYASIITLAINLILYPIMIHQYGLYGAAYASIISGCVIYISSFVLFRIALNKTKWEN